MTSTWPWACNMVVRLGNYDNTLIFLDEIQQYPQYLTWLKFLREEPSIPISWQAVVC